MPGVPKLFTSNLQATPSRARTMIVALALSILLVLELARRALEPECPACAGKSWTTHSTQLQCTGCGWGTPATAVAVKPEPPQYELGFHG